MLGYIWHLRKIGEISTVSDRMYRAAFQVEELIAIINKVKNILNGNRVAWKYPRSIQLIKEIADSAERIVTIIGEDRRLVDENYKGQASYVFVMEKHASKLRTNLET